MNLAKLVLVRHGRAGTAPTDDERRLTVEGRAGVGRIGAALKAGGLAGPAAEATVILCSPLARAVETAGIVAEAVGASPPRVDDRLAPGAEPGDLMAAAKEAGSAAVVLVGHMPDLGVLAGSLTGASSFHLSPGAALVFGVTGDGGAGLEAVLDPEDL